MVVTGRTIQIYLPDGNPQSLKIAEVTSRTVLALLIPRSTLEEAGNRHELESVGIYLLFGQTDAKPLCYIGEAENCLSRLKQHHRSKDFWTHALAFVSKTSYFTKTHIKYLEWYSYERANKANRYWLENGNVPTKPHISEPAEVDLQDNFETIQLLASTLGYPVFDEPRKPVKQKVFYCKGKNANATGEYTEEGMVVFKDSIANLTFVRTAQQWLRNMREQLIDQGVLEPRDNILHFTSDYVFNSPSTAAAIVLARSANGWREWKQLDGRTLDEVKRQS